MTDRRVAILAWSFPEAFPIALGEMRVDGETAGDGHLDNAHPGPVQQVPGARKAMVAGVAGRSRVQIFSEQSLKLALGNADAAGELARGQDFRQYRISTAIGSALEIKLRDRLCVREELWLLANCQMDTNSLVSSVKNPDTFTLSRARAGPQTRQSQDKEPRGSRISLLG